MYHDADVGQDAQTSTGAYVERNKPKPPASPYMAPGANVQDFGGYPPDGAQPAPDDPVYGPYSPPGAIRTGNEASDDPVPSPSFAGSGYTGFQGFNPPPTPVPESGHDDIRTPSRDAIQAPSLIEPRRDAMSAIGRALMSSPHAIGRFLGGLMNSGQLNDEASNQTAMDMFKAKIAQRNQESLQGQQQTLAEMRDAYARRAEAQTDRIENPVAPPVKPHDPDWRYNEAGQPYDANAAEPPKPFTPRGPAPREPKEPSFEKETYDEWRKTREAAGLPSDRMTFSKERSSNTAKGQATSAKTTTDIADMDTNIDVAASVRGLGKKLQELHPHEYTAKFSAVANNAKYKMGIQPSKEYQQLIPLINGLRVYAAGPLLRGLRNQKFVDMIMEHVPSSTDSPQLMLEKLDVLDALMRKIRTKRAERFGLEQRNDVGGGVPIPGLENLDPQIDDGLADPAPAAPGTPAAPAGGKKKLVFNPATGKAE